MGEALELSGRRVTVLGAGRTGREAARFLARRRARVLVSDHAPVPPAVRRELGALGVRLEERGHTERALLAELIVPSPGVPFRAPVLEEARARGIPVLGELELAYRHLTSERIVAVTGTVGKTTTAHLIAELLRAHGHPVVLAGNIGPPLVSCLEATDLETVVVVEASSYQLEYITSFRPHIGVVTRFAPHHLERHGSLSRYLQVKCRQFARQAEGDFAVVQSEIELPRTLRARVLKYSAEDLPPVDGGGKPRSLPPHQRENLAGALLAARLIDPAITPARLDLSRALRLPHRLEFVLELAGVRFYNDSKATSPAATQAAIWAFEEPLALILAGQSEGEELGGLARAVRERGVERVLLMGGARVRWAQRLRAMGYPRFRQVDGFAQAIEAVLSQRPRPRVCLFSPGAPSFDQFHSYEERGERFKQALWAYARSLSPTRVTRPSDQVALRS